MRDELDGRFWTAHHEEFSNGLDRLANKVMDVFRLLNRQYWTAPWDNEEGAGTLSRLIAAGGAVVLSFIVVTGAVAPAEVQARLSTASADYYLA